VNVLLKMRSDYIHPKTTENPSGMIASHTIYQEVTAVIAQVEEAVEAFMEYARNIWPEIGE
jgi:hypothetical protein